ncbi:MAG: phytanoyl-CoA dioxygenase family protein [Litorimonas sp.]
MSNETLVMDQGINDWVSAKFPDAKLSLVVEHPWAKTWRLRCDDQTYFLKHISTDGRVKTSSAIKIAKSFSDVVPSIVEASPELSVLAVKDHDGKELKSRTDNMAVVLPTYAHLQAKAIVSGFKPGTLPKIQINTLYDALLDFLNCEKASNTQKSVCASKFLGSSSARRFHQLFKTLRPILEAYLQQADRLPKTINHCDLRPPNMAKRKDGSIAIFDWDDACWGPAGLSLHAQFSGCVRPHVALNADLSQEHPRSVLKDRDNLDAYIAPFADQGIMAAEEMRPHLSWAIVAGALYYVVNFKYYETPKSATRKVIGKNITKRLNSVLDVMDLIVQSDISDAKRLAETYFSCSQWTRLEKLEKMSVNTLLDLPNMNDAALEQSRKPDIFPAITFSDKERECGVCTPDNARLAAKIYREQGAVLLKNSLNASILEECKEHLFERYDEYFQDKRPKDSLRVGNKRFMITLALAWPLSQPEIFAPPTIMPVLERLLSNKLILGSLVAVTSLPGAKTQSRHRDHHALFPNEDITPPPFATSVMIPLIDMNEEVGVTRLFKGTHLQPTDVANTMPGQDPIVPVGSCFLMDYRVQHQGMANKSSDKIRPVITLVFQRPWFRDYVNYDNQDRMIISKQDRDRVPQEYRRLLDWK